MASLNNVRDGRQSKVFLATFGSSDASSVEKGKMYAVSGKAATSSVFGDLEVGDMFVATAALTLSGDDKAVLITPKFLGGATDKDLSSEKSTTEITCDKDAAENSICEGTVSSSGSITAYDLLEEGETAANTIRQRFNKMVTYGSNGTPEVGTKDRSAKDVFIFLWDSRDLDTDSYVALDFVPALITSLAHGSSYGSGQTFSVNFTGTDTDEAGHKRSYHQFKYFAEFGAYMGLGL